MQPFQQLKTEKSNSVNANVNPHESPLWYVRVAGKHRDGVQAKVAKSDSREREDGAGDLDRSRDDVGSFLARNISDLLSIRVILRGVGRDELAQREVVDNVLYLLHVVLDGVDPLAKNVVLQVEQLEAGVEILDKLGDLHSQLIITESDRVGGETAQLIGELGGSQQILLDGYVKAVSVLHIDRDCR